MTIYLDIVLIENLCMNYIILYATGIIYKTKTKMLRLLFSSAIGAVYAVLAYMQVLEIYSNLLLKFLLSVGMVYLAYSPKTLKILGKQLLLFYITSSVFGGVAFALLYFVKPQDIFMKNGLYIGTYPIKIVALGAIVSYIVIKFALKLIKGKLTRKELFCQILIRLGEEKIIVTAMLDTGNLLKEPITKTPVIIVEKQSLATILPKEILENLDFILDGTNKTELGEYATRFRVIPFSSLGKQNGMLLGMKMDEVEIITEEGNTTVSNVIIGISNESLTKNGLYTALVGLEILEGGQENEFDRITQKQY